MAELEFEHLMESALKLESPLQAWSINNQTARASLLLLTTLFTFPALGLR